MAYCNENNETQLMWEEKPEIIWDQKKKRSAALCALRSHKGKKSEYVKIRENKNKCDLFDSVWHDP